MVGFPILMPIKSKVGKAGGSKWKAMSDEVANFRVEPPGLLRGCGEHPKMSAETSSKRPMKKPNEESSVERPRKKPCAVVEIDSDTEKLYKFRILLPNGRTLELKLLEKSREIQIEDFVLTVKKEYFATKKEGGYPEKRRGIKWDYDDLHFTDAHGKKIRPMLHFYDFVPVEQ